MTETIPTTTPEDPLRVPEPLDEADLAGFGPRSRRRWLRLPLQRPNRRHAARYHRRPGCPSSRRSGGRGSSDLEHEQSETLAQSLLDDDSTILSESRRERSERLIATPYPDLTDAEQEHDRVLARKVSALRSAAPALDVERLHGRSVCRSGLLRRIRPGLESSLREAAPIPASTPPSKEPRAVDLPRTEAGRAFLELAAATDHLSCYVEDLKAIVLRHPRHRGRGFVLRSAAPALRRGTAAEAIDGHSHVGAPSEQVIGCGRGNVLAALLIAREYAALEGAEPLSSSSRRGLDEQCPRCRGLGAYPDPDALRAPGTDGDDRYDVRGAVSPSRVRYRRPDAVAVVVLAFALAVAAIVVAYAAAVFSRPVPTPVRPGASEALPTGVPSRAPVLSLSPGAPETEPASSSYPPALSPVATGGAADRLRCSEGLVGPGLRDRRRGAGSRSRRGRSGAPAGARRRPGVPGQGRDRRPGRPERPGPPGRSGARAAIVTGSTRSSTSTRPTSGP